MRVFSNSTFILLLYFSLFGCINEKKEKSAIDAVEVVPPIITETKSHELETNSFDYDATKIIAEVFVTSKEGAAIKESSKSDAKILGHSEYGSKLEVIEDLGNWLAIRERIQRNYVKDDGTKVESSSWEKVYVAKNQTGSLDKIQLTAQDLDIITSLSINEKTEFFEKGKHLKTYLNFELIDQATFEKEKNNAVNFLTADTTLYIKKNGIITLPTANKSIKITDKPGDDDYREEYKYIGQIEFLNQYLIEGSYYESLDFNFFDKTSGKNKQTFIEYPYISADRKNIICIYGNAYESTSDLELYSINNHEIKLVMTASFSNWFPTAEKLSDIFWSSDGNLYLQVIHIKAMWGERPENQAKPQYVRIKRI